MKSYIVLCLIILIGCKNNQSGIISSERRNVKSVKKQTCNLTINDLKDELLNKNLKTHWDIEECFITKDSLIIGEEEDLKWKAKAFYKNKKLIFLAESNWQNDSILSRITIYDSLFKTKDNIRVGMPFNEIKNKLAFKIPSAPDYYLFVKHKDDNSISFELDISKLDKENKINFGISDLDLIPDTLKVSTIIINYLESK